MAYKEAGKIPAIDFCKADLKQGTPQWELTRTQVFKALEEFGCFEAIYDKVPKEIQESMFDTLGEILPLGTKLEEYSKKPYVEYEGQLPHLPHKIGNMHKTNLVLPGSVDIFVDTFWPNDNSEFRNIVKSYCKGVVQLEEMVKKMVLESLGMEKYMDEILVSARCYYVQLIQYYKAAAAANNNNIGMGSHVDSGFLTIVKQDQPGLQVLPKNQHQWIHLTASPNSYIVLLADSFMAWTNDRLRSVTHRVIMGGDSDRLSIQLFSIPKPGYVVEAPKELVDEEHPLLFKPFDIVKYFKYITSKTTTGADGVGLKAFQEASSEY